MKSLDPDKSFIVNYAPIFADLSASEKNLIIEKSKVVEYKKGDIIYKQSDPAHAFYCVIIGRVKIFNISSGKKEVLEYLNCGKYFGIISLLTQEPHSVNAEAANDSKILMLSKEDFQAILHKIPNLAIDLSKTLSRRLRKKDTQEKRIFESNIMSVFSAVREVGRTMYAVNLALSLKKETGKSVILIDVTPSVSQKPTAPVLLDTPFLTDSAIRQAILQEKDAGISILNISYDSANSVYAANLNALLTYLTGDYHYVIVDLPALMDAVIFQLLNQSDLIHIITDYDAHNLEKTKALLSDLFRKVNYPQDKIKVIINAGIEGKGFSHEEVSKSLDYKIYATLPLCLERASRVILEEPHSEYAKVIRRIARDVGDVRVGLALSGGAAFGLVHVGVIKVLEKENIPIDMVAGSSIGALIGALWASGFDSEELAKITLTLNNKKKVFRLLVEPSFPKLSFSKGRRLRDFLEKYIADKTFQDTRFPLKVVACNLSKRQELIYDTGKLIDAVMASIAIPGIFSPTKINGDLIIDGGIIAPVPIGTLVKLGIKKIIAVNVFPSPENIKQNYEFNLRRRDEEKRQAELKGFFAKIAHNLGMRFNRMLFPNILDIIVNSIQTLEYVIAETDCQKANIVIRPIATGVDWYEFFKAEELIKKGEEEARNSLAALKSLIRE